MKMYRTNYGSNIEEREVVKVTEASVYWIGRTGKEERELITTNFHKWHKTKEDAIQYLKNRDISRIEYLKKEISMLEKQIAEREK